MKVKHLTSYINNKTENFKFRGKPKSQVSGHNIQHTNALELRKDKIELNTRPAESVNFGGSASSKAAEAIKEALGEISQGATKKSFFGFARNRKGELTKTSEKITGFIDSKNVQKALLMVKENEALFENIITIVLAGLLKPICVLAMPGAEKEDKQVAATKNFVAAVVGFVISTIILTPISKSVGKVTKNLHKYIKDPEYVKLIDPKNLDSEAADAFSTFYKKAADLVITPTKAAITIGLTPYLLDFLFKDRKKLKDEKDAIEVQGLYNKLQQMKLNENEQIFNKFAKGEIK